LSSSRGPGCPTRYISCPRPVEWLRWLTSRRQKGDKIKRAHHLAVEMVLVHNMLLRGINSIYRQAVAVERTPERVRDFVGYAAVWADTVEEHHGGEETVVFPELERRLGLPGLMDGNVAQHRAFHAGLEAYAAYTAAVLAGDEVYDGVRFRALIDSFMPVLREHLSDEIDTLLRLDEHDDKTDLAVFMTDIQKQLTSRAQDPDIKASPRDDLDRPDEPPADLPP